MTEIQKFLLENKDEGYWAFTRPLIPNVEEKSFIGVRLHVIKKYAKDLDERSRNEFLDSLPHVYHEENLLHAFILSNIKDFEEFIKRTDAFLPFVSNWSVCDTICNKHLHKHKEALLPVIYQWLQSQEVYRVRYAIKCLMNYYLDDDFREEHLEKVREVRLEDYYVKMMVAWYLATGLAKNYDPFLKAIEARSFDPWIHNKAIQKAAESFRVSDEHKTYLKSLKIR